MAKVVKNCCLIFFVVHSQFSPWNYWGKVFRVFPVLPSCDALKSKKLVTYNH